MLKRRIERLEEVRHQNDGETVFLWGDAPAPDGLKPGQEVIRLRWRDEREANGVDERERTHFALRGVSRKRLTFRWSDA